MRQMENQSRPITNLISILETPFSGLPVAMAIATAMWQ